MYPYKVINKDGKPIISIKYKDEEKQFAPEEISAMVLSKIKVRAEEMLQCEITKAVITVPANFNVAQRQATKYAGQIAGLKVLRIINEPTAAVLSYELDRKYKDKESKVLIYDFGGGTFDVSIASVHNGVVEVIATDGNPYLGGDDIDLRIANYIIQKFKTDSNFDIIKDKNATEDTIKSKLAHKAFRRILKKSETAKIQLSQTDFVEIDFDSLYHDEDFECTLTKSQFQEICSDIFENTMECVKQTLEDAGIKATDVDEVVLVGGSTRIPFVREMLKKYFNKEINIFVHPDEAVANGAARQAAIIDCPGYTKAKSIQLIDVCSLSLGINVKGEMTSIVIPRNTKIPCKITKIFETVEDNQTIIHVGIYEGERIMSDANRFLDSFLITDLKPAPKGQTEIDVTFNIDENGILTVVAAEKNGDSVNNVSIDMNKYQLNEEVIETLIKQAEVLKKWDEDRRQFILAKMEFEEYCNNVKKETINETNITKKSDILKKCEAVLKWLHTNIYWSRDEIKAKEEELKACVTSSSK